MDWFTRKVLAWRISNTLEADFCVEALNEAIHRFDAPGIMNTDQGSQFTSFVWTDRLKRALAPGSRWTARGAASTTSSSSASGGPSSMNASTCTLGKRGRRPRLPSANGLPSIIIGDPTPPMVGSRPP
ncbi:hypothetical protein PYTT13_09375 [Paracoccus yeei]|uniref:Integrase catalytic domain-containing protein n=1 Tax=Paracoccus yeei TaxID=147645 RepID=A0A2D2C0G7_9RHOB|nr:hypothetical protein PYTT13_09375 [Paracoccus yeei]